MTLGRRGWLGGALATLAVAGAPGCGARGVGGHVASSHSAPSDPASSAPASLASVARAHFAELERAHTPGLVLGVRREGEAPLRMALGHADLEGTPMDTAMHFYAGSVSKLFVGTACLSLLEGPDASAPASRTLAPIVEDMLAALGLPRDITLRHLGTHTSGLADAIGARALREAIDQNPARVFTDDEVLAYALSQEIGPRGVYRYASTNTVLLGRALERVDGVPVNQSVTQRVHARLGLRASRFADASGLPSPRPRGYRHGRGPDTIRYGDTFFDASAFHPSWAGVGGSLISTLDDLLTAIEPLATGALLGPAGRAALTDFGETGEPGERYGFCLADDHGALGHAGDVPGFSAYAVWCPTARASVVVLANLSNTADGRSPARELGRVLVRALREGATLGSA